MSPPDRSPLLAFIDSLDYTTDLAWGDGSLSGRDSGEGFGFGCANGYGWGHGDGDAFGTDTGYGDGDGEWTDDLFNQERNRRESILP